MSDLDLTKPVQTKAEGFPVTLWTTEAKGPHPVQGTVHQPDYDKPTYLALTGKWPHSSDDYFDLVNVPEPTPVVLAEGQPYPVLWRGRTVDVAALMPLLDQWFLDHEGRPISELFSGSQAVVRALGRVWKGGPRRK